MKNKDLCLIYNETTVQWIQIYHKKQKKYNNKYLNDSKISSDINCFENKNWYDIFIGFISIHDWKETLVF